VFPAYHVRTEAPEKSTDQHSHVDCDGQAGTERRLKFVARIGGNNGLEEQDERVDGVAVKWSVCCASSGRRIL
jgi:hypothetical protein